MPATCSFPSQATHNGSIGTAFSLDGADPVDDRRKPDTIGQQPASRCRRRSSKARSARPNTSTVTVGAGQGAGDRHRLRAQFAGRRAAGPDRRGAQQQRDDPRHLRRQPDHRWRARLLRVHRGRRGLGDLRRVHRRSRRHLLHPRPPYGSRPSGTFAQNGTFVLNVSVAGHATSAATTMGADTINGGDGDDQIFGQVDRTRSPGDRQRPASTAAAATTRSTATRATARLRCSAGGEPGPRRRRQRRAPLERQQARTSAIRARTWPTPASGTPETLDGGGGVDTLDVSSFTASAYVVNPHGTGATITTAARASSASRTWFPAHGGDTITGSAAANVIRTGATATTRSTRHTTRDTVEDGLGGDTLNGGKAATRHADLSMLRRRDRFASPPTPRAAATPMATGFDNFENVPTDGGHDVIGRICRRRRCLHRQRQRHRHRRRRGRRDQQAGARRRRYPQRRGRRDRHARRGCQRRPAAGHRPAWRGTA